MLPMPQPRKHASVVAAPVGVTPSIKKNKYTFTRMAKLLNTLRRFPSKKQSGKMHADASDKTWKIF